MSLSVHLCPSSSILLLAITPLPLFIYSPDTSFQFPLSPFTRQCTRPSRQLNLTLAPHPSSSSLQPFQIGSLRNGVLVITQTLARAWKFKCCSVSLFLSSSHRSHAPSMRAITAYFFMLKHRGWKLIKEALILNMSSAMIFMSCQPDSGMEAGHIAAVSFSTRLSHLLVLSFMILCHLHLPFSIPSVFESCVISICIKPV